jgi:nucleoid-associated protein YgaU
MVEVMEGDTLPSLCKKIYDNPNYYVEIAKINQLKSVRNLKVGQKLYFPPLK